MQKFNVILKFLWLMVLSLASSMFASAQQLANIPGDFPDPSVIWADGKYYAVGTTSEWGPHFGIYVSDNLEQWEQVGFALEQTPDWALSSFWAPEFVYHKGTYYLYYSAKRKSDGVSVIAVATSKYPDRGYVDQGEVVAYGSESIDAFVVEEDGKRYMTWKAYGLDQRPIELLASELSDDGLSLKPGKPVSLLLDTAGVGIEGQSFIQKDGYYYMFYSAGACCGAGCDYRVQAVRSKHVLGPYTHVGEAVLLDEDDLWKCMGHGTFVEKPNGEMYYLFHGYSKQGTINVGREGLLAKLLWSDKGDPVFQRVAASAGQSPGFYAFDFLQEQKAEELFLQWDFRHSKPDFSLSESGLQLSSREKPESPAGLVLTRRASSAAYSIRTGINVQQSQPEALKGLALYGDELHALGWGLQNKRLLLWHIQDNDLQEIAHLDLNNTPLSAQVELRMDIGEDLSVQVYYRVSDQEPWQALELPESLSAENLAPWDRSPRAGLQLRGEPGQKAYFTYLSQLPLD